MKFESKFGVGEIVIYDPHQREAASAKSYHDALLEVQAVIFEIGGTVRYVCRYPSSGITGTFAEGQLLGDPDFDQETGYDEF